VKVAKAKAEMDAAFEKKDWNEFRSREMEYLRLIGRA